MTETYDPKAGSIDCLALGRKSLLVFAFDQSIQCREPLLLGPSAMLPQQPSPDATLQAAL